MIPLIGEASSVQFGVDFDGVSLSPGFVCLSSGFFAFDGDGVDCASLPSLAVMSLSRMTGVRLTRPRGTFVTLSKSESLWSFGITHSLLLSRCILDDVVLALPSSRAHNRLRVGRKGPKQYRFGPASVDSYFRRFSLCVQVSCFLPFLLAPPSTTHLLYLRFHSK